VSELPLASADGEDDHAIHMPDDDDDFLEQVQGIAWRDLWVMTDVHRQPL
jgi:hypothetical protein